MIRAFTIKEMIPYIVKGQRNNLTLHKNFSLKIDEEFFKIFSEKKYHIYIYVLLVTFQNIW